MNSKILALVVFLVAGAFTLETLASPAPSPQVIGTKCWCCPRVTVTLAPGCNCTVQLQNEIRQIGTCKIGQCFSGGPCGDPEKVCKLIATAVEIGTGCTGSKSINLVAPCSVQNVTDTLQCTNGSSNNHTIRLDCDPCTCPQVFNCP